LLDGHLAAEPRALSDDWMFPNSLGRPLDTANLVNRVIRPAFAAAGLKWHGFHAFRRGLGTTLDSLGVREQVIQRILRHKPCSPVTREHYIQAPTQDVVEAMEHFQESLVAKTGRSPAVPRLLN
jgi:integrase